MQEKPVNKKLSIYAPRIHLREVVLYGMMFAGAIILWTFHNDETTLGGRIKAVNDTNSRLQQSLVKAQQFIDEDCAFQYIRLTNTNTRFSKLSQIDRAFAKFESDEAANMEIAAAYRAKGNDKVAALYWKNLAYDESQHAKTRADQVKLDDAAMKAFSSQNGISKFCKQPASKAQKSFITGTPKP